MSFPDEDDIFGPRDRYFSDEYDDEPGGFDGGYGTDPEEEDWEQGEFDWSEHEDLSGIEEPETGPTTRIDSSDISRIGGGRSDPFRRSIRGPKGAYIDKLAGIIAGSMTLFEGQIDKVKAYASDVPEYLLLRYNPKILAAAILYFLNYGEPTHTGVKKFLEEIKGAFSGTSDDGGLDEIPSFVRYIRILKFNDPRK